MSVQVGDEYPIRYRAVNADRELIAATLTLTVTDPSGNPSTPTPSNPSTGIYEYAIDVDEAGFWQYQWTVTSPYDDVDKGQFTAEAFAAMNYISLPLFKANLKTTAVGHDELMQFAIDTAREKIHEHCYRPGIGFWQGPTTVVRDYDPNGRTSDHTVSGYIKELLLTDDIASTTGLTVQVGYGSSWTTIDSSSYEFWPDNALALGRPIEGIIRQGALWTTHPRQRVRVTARPGFPAVPQSIKQAQLIQSLRYYLRKDSPEGVMGSAEWGGMIRMARIDPDVVELLKDFVKYGAGSTG